MIPRENLEALCKLHGVSSHAAKGPLFMRFKDDIILATDYKAPTYPPVNFRDKPGFFGGNWNKVAQETPEQVYLTEVVKEEVKPLGKLITSGYFCFGEYFAVIPPQAHGNPAQQERVFLNPVTLFVSIIDGNDALDALKCTRENLHPALSASTDYKASAVIPFSDIKNGRLAYDTKSQLIWGDDQMLADVLGAVFGLCIGRDYQIVFMPDTKVYRLNQKEHDITLNMPFKDRWTVPYQMKNPLAAGKDFSDKSVFTANPPQKKD
jgi:hypothetical protein